jgi:hypothetical protein
MYLVVDEVKLTLTSPNPFVDTQVERKVEYADGEYPLKITTSSHSSIGSLDSEDARKNPLLICYICGQEFSCVEFLDHEVACKEVMPSSRSKLTTTDSETQTPRMLHCQFSESELCCSSYTASASISAPQRRFRVNSSPSFFPL